MFESAELPARLTTGWQAGVGGPPPRWAAVALRFRVVTAAAKAYDVRFVAID